MPKKYLPMFIIFLALFIPNVSALIFDADGNGALESPDILMINNINSYLTWYGCNYTYCMTWSCGEFTKTSCCTNEECYDSDGNWNFSCECPIGSGEDCDKYCIDSYNESTVCEVGNITVSACAEKGFNNYNPTLCSDVDLNDDGVITDKEIDEVLKIVKNRMSGTFGIYPFRDKLRVKANYINCSTNLVIESQDDIIFSDGKISKNPLTINELPCNFDINLSYTLGGKGKYTIKGTLKFGDVEVITYTSIEDNDGDGFVGWYYDCDDNDASTYPGAKEVCDGKDNNCDGFVDRTDIDGNGWLGPEEGLIENALYQWYYNDVDQDGWGDNVNWGASWLCAPYLTIAATKAGDCNDKNPSIHPGAKEICGNGVDEDCDGSDAVCLPVTGSGTNAGIYYTSTSTTPCTPSWTCDEWSECSPEGIQTRFCQVVESCGNETSKIEHQTCEYIPASEEVEGGQQVSNETGQESGQETQESTTQPSLTGAFLQGIANYWYILLIAVVAIILVFVLI
ncbi:MAG: putative metal-binding motif-containing protein [Candidatus Aenigmatarchaeota archaeon]